MNLNELNPLCCFRSLFLTHSVTAADHCLTNRTTWETRGTTCAPTASVYRLMNYCFSSLPASLWSPCSLHNARRRFFWGGKWSRTKSCQSLPLILDMSHAKNICWKFLKRNPPLIQSGRISRLLKRGRSSSAAWTEQIKESGPWSNKIIVFLNPRKLRCVSLFFFLEAEGGGKQTAEVETGT